MPAVKPEPTHLAGALLCIALALQPADAADRKKKAPAPKSQATAPATRQDALPEPPAGGFAERLAWGDKEADALRKAIAASPKDEIVRNTLAALATFVAGDLERALAAGDTEAAKGFRTLIEKKLADTRWRLGIRGRDGSGASMFALGVIALHGILGPRDPEIACPLFASAWDKGTLESAYRLSECVAAKDPARATSLLESAAEAGHAGASELLGRRCLEARPPDAQCAVRRVGAAAEAGRPSARSLRGWMYAQGIGAPADPARALALYTQAALAGDLSAMNNLGEFHETGRTVPADAGRAFGYYKGAAEAGFAPAQFNLGRMYAAGIGVARDPAQARIWLTEALKGGIQPAQRILDWLDSPASQAPSPQGQSPAR